MKKIKGFTLIELLIVVAIIAILAAIAVPNFLEAQVRSKVSRVKADQRSLATAIEAYYVDNNAYPAWASNGFANAASLTAITPNAFMSRGLTVNANFWAGSNAGQLDSIRNHRSFAIHPWPGSVSTLGTLTTPVSFISTYPKDPFATTRGACMGYYSDAQGLQFILYSFGPDTDEAIGSELNVNVESIIAGYSAQPSPTLVTGFGFKISDTATPTGQAYTYDPTNGTTSPGDVYRVKQ